MGKRRIHKSRGQTGLIYYVKDPFELYDTKSDQVEEVQSARMKLAALKAKSHVEDELLTNAEHDLEQVIQLEQKDIMNVVITPKLNLCSEEKKIFLAIKETYSNIFQALTVMLGYYSANPTELENVHRRSREFGVRLNRSVFEAKQQVRILLENCLYCKSCITNEICPDVNKSQPCISGPV